MITAEQANKNLVQSFARRLPMYCYMGVEYFVDFRLKELRPKDRPQTNIPFAFICDPQTKADLRALRAEFSTPCYMAELDG